ncbi:hypothetical protein HN358_01935 [Candidatus Uhrbacteria bacterium]|nr:hypothetical protein [Candidatus Uhrbacteria bacterium]MBT7716865.1 hypothetical protein [Candidatus Uhrbacteria bacterium]
MSADDAPPTTAIDEINELNSYTLRVEHYDLKHSWIQQVDINTARKSFQKFNKPFFLLVIHLFSQASSVLCGNAKVLFRLAQLTYDIT